MSLPMLVKIVAREFATRQQSPRITEPDLVMDDPDKVAAYVRAGREDGVMAPVYLFHCAQICEVVRPGDTVVDLACGPATQLSMAARLNPDTHFIGVDLSPSMIDQARAHIEEQKLNNVEIREGSITDLSMFDENSIDAVTSTVALHHLPDLAALDRVFREIGRILRKDGGLYLVDFGHLKADQSIIDFAHQYQDRQAELFTLDYLYSLRAAFTLADFKTLTFKHLLEKRVYATFAIPYFVVVKSHNRNQTNRKLLDSLKAMRNSMPNYHQNDLSLLLTLFRLGGLKSTLLV